MEAERQNGRNMVEKALGTFPSIEENRCGLTSPKRTFALLPKLPIPVHFQATGHENRTPNSQAN